MSAQQADHEPSADDEEIGPERHLERALRQRVRDLDAERRGDERGRHHQERTDQRDVAERERQLQRGDVGKARGGGPAGIDVTCLLYTSDAADE